MKWSPFALLGLSQAPFHLPEQSPLPANRPRPMAVPGDDLYQAFQFKDSEGRFNPHDLITAARPGAAVANDAGDLVVATRTKYDITSRTDSKAAFVFPAVEDTNVQALEIPLEKSDQLFWLDGENLAKASKSSSGKTLELSILPISFQLSSQSPTGVGFVKLASDPIPIGTIPSSSATNFRYTTTGGFLVFSDAVYSDGNLSAINDHDETWENRGTSALVYDETFERHWDEWILPKKNSLFSVQLKKDPDHNWLLGTEFNNLLKGTGLASPVEPFGGTDDFDISAHSVIFTAKDPKLPKAMHTKQNVYLAHIDGSSHPRELTSGNHGATHSPVLNTDGTKAAWLQQDKDGAEADRAKIIIHDFKKNVQFTLTQKWDRSPDALAFSKSSTDGNDEFIYFTAGDIARVKSFVLPLPPTPHHSTTNPSLGKKFETPVVLTSTGAASGLQVLPYGRVLISRSSLTTPNEYFLISGLQDLEDAITRSDEPVTFNGDITKLASLAESSLADKQLFAGEEFWFKGAQQDIQGWVVKPFGWEAGQKKKYPVAFLIHGGPQGAWEDQWSTRWNPNVFAGQGYFTILINPSGSTTFGQKLTDAISEDWGGKIFTDLQNGWKHILKTYPEVDHERAVGLGASFGGYAINWIQGHPEYNFKFKALVCHDGVFDAAFDGYATEELFFNRQEWGGSPFEKKAKELLAKFSPANFVDKWSTPQLTIHGSKDYRLAETEGIAAFHALQLKGVPSRLVIFPDENHWVLKHLNSLKWHYEVFRWMDEYIGEK